MQHTMVVVDMGGGGCPLGKNKRLRVRGKNEKGERKTEENYINNGEKGLKNSSFWVINSKKSRPARRKLISREKKMNLKK